VRFYSLLLVLLLSAPLSGFSATLAEYTFDDPQKTDEFRSIISEMRCLVCQNESLAGSSAELAVDLRNEIYDMMKAGQGKDEVVDFMVARYGDFVLYDPPVKLSTYPIWFGPIVLFMIGAIVFYRNMRRKSLSRETELSAEQQQRLQSLLKQTPAQHDPKQTEKKDADQ